MHRVLTTVLAFYWMTEFAILAGCCVARFDSGLHRAFQLLGLDGNMAADSSGGILEAASFGTGFALVSLLFAWALITRHAEAPKAGQADDILKLAFAASASVLMAVTLAGIALGRVHVLMPIGVELIALLVSYLVIRSEQIARPARDGEKFRAATSLPRAMAVNAAVQYSVGATINMPSNGGSR